MHPPTSITALLSPPTHKHTQSPLNPALRKSDLTLSRLFFSCKLGYSTVCFWVCELNRAQFTIGGVRGFGFVTGDQHPKKQETANSQGWTSCSLLDVFTKVSQSDLLLKLWLNPLLIVGMGILILLRKYKRFLS